MTVIRRFKVHSKLRAALLDGKGVRASEAIARAEAGVQSMAAECAAAVRAVIAEIERDYGPAAPDRAGHEPLELYALSARIIESAIGEDDAPLIEACLSFCDLLDACAEDDAWDWPAVDVHIQTLKLLGGETVLPEGGARALIAELGALRRHREQARA